MKHRGLCCYRTNNQHTVARFVPAQSNGALYSFRNGTRFFPSLIVMLSIVECQRDTLVPVIYYIITAINIVLSPVTRN